MKLRAVIFDVYCTLLEVGPPPADVAARWDALWRDTFGGVPGQTYAEFTAGCARAVDRDHATARAAGIAHPEVFWPDIVAGVLPALNAVPPAGRDAFMARQIALTHTVRLMPGTATVLQRLRQHGVLLGIASNAQPYTLRELADALAGSGLARSLFAPDLCFWSFEHGFSKPDPHVFRLLTARLLARGVGPGETLMIGDRADNDIAPARLHGWQTWRLTGAAEPGGGDWPRLEAWLDQALAPD